MITYIYILIVTVEELRDEGEELFRAVSLISRTSWSVEVNTSVLDGHCFTPSHFVRAIYSLIRLTCHVEILTSDRKQVSLNWRPIRVSVISCPSLVREEFRYRVLVTCGVRRILRCCAAKTSLHPFPD